MKKLFLLFAPVLFFACKNQPKTEHVTADTSTVVKLVEKRPSLDKDSLSQSDAEWLVKPVYDTVANSPQTDSPADTITRDDASLKYVEDQSGKYYVYVVENRGPMYGTSLGWCDVFIFKKENGKWRLNDFSLQAGAGGMYGNPGSLEKLIKIGDERLGIVISGGQAHMGNNYHVTVIEFGDGKLGNNFQLSTHHDYGEGAGDDYKITVCDENEFYFKKGSNSKNYDLIIKRFNCVEDPPKKVDSLVIPYLNGYQIPERFSFEG
jgi:hypothetical protein